MIKPLTDISILEASSASMCLGSARVLIAPQMVISSRWGVCCESSLHGAVVCEEVAMARVTVTSCVYHESNYNQLMNHVVVVSHTN